VKNWLTCLLFHKDNGWFLRYLFGFFSLLQIAVPASLVTEIKNLQLHYNTLSEKVAKMARVLNQLLRDFHKAKHK
jgi:hypothetical protein